MRTQLVFCVALGSLAGLAVGAPLATATLDETSLSIVADGDPAEWFADAALGSTTEGAITITPGNVLVFRDPADDDLGDGDYTNPLGTAYGNESDLRELRLAINASGWNFLLVQGQPTTGLAGADPESSQFVEPAGTNDGAGGATTSTGPTTPVDLTGVVSALVNTNAGGVLFGTAADSNGATVNTGFEFFIPAAALKRTGFAGGDTVSVFAIITGNTGYKSNQTLPGATVFPNNNPGFTTTSYAASNFATFTSTAPASPIAFGASGITVDGSTVADAAAYTAGGGDNEVQTSQTQFGDDTNPSPTAGGGSELDQGYLRVFSDGIALALNGNLETNGNRLIIFIDSVPAAGETVLAANPGDVQGVAGMTGDTLPFAADVALEINAGTGTQYFIDWVDLDAPALPTFAGVGTIMISTRPDDGSGTLGKADTFQFSEGTLLRSTAAADDTAWEGLLVLGGNNDDGFGNGTSAGETNIDAYVTGVNSFNEGISVAGGTVTVSEFQVSASGFSNFPGYDPLGTSLLNISVWTGFSENGGAIPTEINDVASSNQGAGGTSGFGDFDAYDLLSAAGPAGQSDQNAEIAAGLIDGQYIGVTFTGVTQTAVPGFELYR